MKKGSFLYRFVVITIVYAFFVSALLVPLASVGALPTWAFWTLFGVFVGLYFLLIGINEIVVAKRKHEHH